jgi:hypothetical protein
MARGVRIPPSRIEGGERMTMKPWLARALRRALGTMGILLAAENALYRVHHARPDLPPPGVDRVEVVTMEGSRSITDRAAIEGILDIVRSHAGEWSRVPGTVCLLGSPGATFYQGAAFRGTMVWGPGSIVLNDRRMEAVRMLSPRDAAELQRLMGRVMP